MRFKKLGHLQFLKQDMYPFGVVGARGQGWLSVQSEGKKAKLQIKGANAFLTKGFKKLTLNIFQNNFKD